MIRDPSHGRAQELAIEALLLSRDGREVDARAKYREGAAFERQALHAVPHSKPRTRGVLAISAASLLYKGKQLGNRSPGSARRMGLITSAAALVRVRIAFSRAA